MNISLNIRVGTKIWFAEETQGYTVRARGDRYFVCTKPMNAKKTVIYTVVDIVESVRGTEDLVFGMGAETDKECEEMIQRLEDPAQWYGTAGRSASEVSHRNRIPLHIAKIII